MENRIYHGNLTPDGLAQALVAEFNRGNLRAQKLGNGDQVVVQIASSQAPASGGLTALAIHLETVVDGVLVQIGKQTWYGVAASLGRTAFETWLNPFNLLGRLDDIAQDLENLQLSERAWQTIAASARAAGASAELSERFRRTMCVYCFTANPIGEASCIACGAPLGMVQPLTCKNCGFIVKRAEAVCPNCGDKL